MVDSGGYPASAPQYLQGTARGNGVGQVSSILIFEYQLQLLDFKKDTNHEPLDLHFAIHQVSSSTPRLATRATTRQERVQRMGKAIAQADESRCGTGRHIRNHFIDKDSTSSM